MNKDGIHRGIEALEDAQVTYLFATALRAVLKEHNYKPIIDHRTGEVDFYCLDCCEGEGVIYTGLCPTVYAIAVELGVADD